MVMESGRDYWPASLSTEVTGTPSEPAGSWIKIGITLWAEGVDNQSQIQHRPGGQSWDMRNGQIKESAQIKSFIIPTVEANLGAEMNAVRRFTREAVKLGRADLYFIMVVTGTQQIWWDNSGAEHDYMDTSIKGWRPTLKGGNTHITADFSLVRAE